MKHSIIWFLEPALSLLVRQKGATDIFPNAHITKSSDEQYVALVSGRAIAAVTAIDNIMDWNCRNGPKDFRVFAQIERTTLLTLVARSGINEISEISGGRLLVDAPDNGFIVAARALLAEAGVPAESYDLVPAGGVRERLEALMEGKGDATLLGPPFDHHAEARGANILARVNDKYPEFPGQGLVLRTCQLPEFGKYFAHWLTLLEETRVWAQANPIDALKQLVQNELPEPVAMAFIDSLPLSLIPNQAGVDLLIQQRRNEKLPGGNVTYSDLVALDLLKTNTN